MMMTYQLTNEDLSWCLRRMPVPVRDLLKDRTGELAVAGGFIRACIANEKPNDIDVFSPSRDCAEASARRLADENRGRLITTDNAFTVIGLTLPVQFIHRWNYATPASVVHSFDFTIARAAIWREGTSWASECDPRFYIDLAAKRLVYCAPLRIEEAGGSLLRVLKFYQRGYRIPLDSFGAVIARAIHGLHGGGVNLQDEQAVAKVITGLLREVDPNVDPLHEAHLPSTDQHAEEESPNA